MLIGLASDDGVGLVLVLLSIPVLVVFLIVVVVKTGYQRPLPVAPKLRLAHPDVRCPACHGDLVVRVRASERVASGVAGGLLFGRAARAQFRCERCRCLF